MRTIGAERPDTQLQLAVILGVDTHLDFHVAVDHLGREAWARPALGETSVPTSAKGYERLLRGAVGFGPVKCAGVEGTSSYGAGLARHLRTRGMPASARSFWASFPASRPPWTSRGKGRWWR